MTKNCINFIVVRRKCLFNCFPHPGAVTFSTFSQPTMIFRFELLFLAIRTVPQFSVHLPVILWIVILLSLFPAVISITPNFEEFVCKPRCLFSLHTLWFYRCVVTCNAIEKTFPEEECFFVVVFKTTILEQLWWKFLCTFLDSTEHNAMIADAWLQNIGLHDPVRVVSEHQVNRGARILSDLSRFTNNLCCNANSSSF